MTRRWGTTEGMRKALHESLLSDALKFLFFCLVYFCLPRNSYLSFDWSFEGLLLKNNFTQLWFWRWNCETPSLKYSVRSISECDGFFSPYYGSGEIFSNSRRRENEEYCSKIRVVALFFLKDSKSSVCNNKEWKRTSIFGRKLSIYWCFILEFVITGIQTNKLMIFNKKSQLHKWFIR